MKKIVYAIIFIATLSLISCGGGGGGDGSTTTTTTTVLPTPNYSGTWSFNGFLFINDCNLVAPTVFTATPIVSHSGNNVVVVSGSVVLTGRTNDKDGFEVASQPVSYISGCVSVVAYVFEGASDGNAAVGFGYAGQCGSRVCTVGYGGTAVRLSYDSTISIENKSDTSLDSLMDKCAEQIFEKRLDSSKEDLPLDQEGLKAAATEAAMSVISDKPKNSPVR